jgi:6,7-dimethyl-8-ribityllumazine synthase
VAESDSRWAIVVATFYSDLAQRLVEGAQRVFSGAADVYEVPGAFELPLAAKYCADAGYSGVACLGAVIRGETSHYDHVCESAAEGILRVGLDTGVPCSFGLLTVESMDQALARLGEKRHQGEDAARAVVEMARLRSSVS